MLCWPSCDPNRSTLRLRDVNNNHIVWTGKYGDYNSWTIGGLHSVYRLETQCICTSRIHIWNNRSY